MYSLPGRRLAKGELVLVTGANGYIASHIVDLFLEEGYNVRGTVRAVKPWLIDYFVDKYGPGRFETVIVQGMENESSFDEAVKGVSGVVHTASDLTINPDPNQVIPKVVAGSLNLMAAAASQPSIKSVVLTSSCAASYVIGSGSTTVVDQGVCVCVCVCVWKSEDIKDWSRLMWTDADTWNDAAVQAAWSDETPAEARGFQVYTASKVEGEREAWRWFEKNKPGYAFNTILPPFNVGPILCPEIGGSTMGFVRQLLEGDGFVTKLLPPQWHINVRDDARVHVAALLDPSVNCQRLFPFATPFNWTDIIGLLRRLRPENDRIPPPPPNEGRDTMEIKLRGKAEELIQSFFGVDGYVGLEESVAAGLPE
ncbi:Aldehyde reductase 2 [Fonsecaea pedrosoi]|nr:Aldehyde reductase 2 [Fonsecaea pedrosoi]